MEFVSRPPGPPLSSCIIFNYRDGIHLQHVIHTGIIAILLLAGCTGSQITEQEYADTPSTEFIIAEVLGQHCMHDAECQTPFEWARRSLCPYEARCIEQQCTVVCPKPFASPQAECRQLHLEFHRMATGNTFCEDWNFDTVRSQEPQWVGQELTDILGPEKLLFVGEDIEVELLVPKAEYTIGAFYRFDLGNVCRERLILADSRNPSPFLNDLVTPIKMNCASAFLQAHPE